MFRPLIQLPAQSGTIVDDQKVSLGLQVLPQKSTFSGCTRTIHPSVLGTRKHPKAVPKASYVNS